MSALAFNNSKVQELRRLLGRRSSRHDAGRFVVEGPVLVAEAVAAGWTCEAQFVPAGSDAAIDGAGPVFELADGVLERVGSTDTPQAPLAVVAMPDADPGLLATAQFVVVLDRVTDPGNLGTILRSAEAAGADLVVLTSGSVDPYNPKVVRSSAGAVFHVPVVAAEIAEVAAAGIRLFGTTSHHHPGRTVTSHTEADFTGRTALVMGNEAAGLPDAWNDDVGPIGSWVTIPHQGRSESLNVAMATTVLAFEAARQRRGQ
ncbi:MAG: RNA methyltransferase [Ilumatobacteraceae bacterium]|jgi:TrmH family RNA methyltransferase